MADEIVKGPDLTGKQEAFCHEYLVDLNGTQAAIRAGYSPTSAAEVASQNLRMSNIRERISQLRELTGKGFNITRERIAQELARIGFSDLRNLFDEKGALKTPDNWPDDIAATISSVDNEEMFEGRGEEREMIGYLKKVKLWDKVKALEQLTRLMGFNAPEKAPVDNDGKTVTPQLHIKIIRDTASSIAPGDFTPQSTTGTESSEAV